MGSPLHRGPLSIFRVGQRAQALSPCFKVPPEGVNGAKTLFLLRELSELLTEFHFRHQAIAITDFIKISFENGFCGDFVTFDYEVRTIFLPYESPYELRTST